VQNPIVQDKVAHKIIELLEWAKEDDNIENFAARLTDSAIEKKCTISMLQSPRHSVCILLFQWYE
jgi:hypothetical protein